MRPFDYLAAEFPTKYSELDIISRMSLQLDLKPELVLAVVEESRSNNKEDGYHNFKHSLIAAAYCSDNYPRNRAYWFAMLFHDTHWSKTKDRHNVFASIYRASKVLAKYPELGLDQDTVARLISYTCFEDGKFNTPAESSYLSDFSVIHIADVYSGQCYDVWPAQYRGLAEECGWPEDYITLKSHLAFVMKDFDDCVGICFGSQLLVISSYIYQIRTALAGLDLESIVQARHDFMHHEGIMPNILLIEVGRFKRLSAHANSRNYVDPASKCLSSSLGRIMGMDVIEIKDGLKVGFVR